jgi:hypothetical protein
MAISYNSNYDLTIPFSDVSVRIGLAANTVLTYTIPGDALTKYAVRFAYNEIANVFVRLNAAPTVPTGVSSEPYSEYRPGDDGSQRYVQGGDVLQFITPDATAYVGFSLRQLQG